MAVSNKHLRVLRLTGLYNSKVINGRVIIGKGSTPPACAHAV